MSSLFSSGDQTQRFMLARHVPIGSFPQPSCWPHCLPLYYKKAIPYFLRLKSNTLETEMENGFKFGLSGYIVWGHFEVHSLSQRKREMYKY